MNGFDHIHGTYYAKVQKSGNVILCRGAGLKWTLKPEMLAEFTMWLEQNMPDIHPRFKYESSLYHGPPIDGDDCPYITKKDSH
jgi:hypothetical protein|tara:strand:- start:2001 stop:2249 length:249 start_codon:yes stop_codon:yes gene_type:complete